MRLLIVRAFRWPFAVAAIVLTWLSASSLAAPDINLYTVPLRADGPNQIVARQREFIEFVACGNEQWFRDTAANPHPGEDGVTAVLGKLMFGRVEGPESKCMWDYGDPNVAKAHVEAAARLTGNACGSVQGSVVMFDWPCLRAQANARLLALQVYGSPGSSDLPCIRGADLAVNPIPQIGMTEGEWDVAVRDLTRIVWMDRRAPGFEAQQDGFYLDRNVRDHVSNDLLTLDQGPAPETYAFGGCGNDQHSTGSADERADEREWTDSVLGDIGDLEKWLRNFLTRLALLVVAGSIAGAIAVAIAGPVGAALVGAAIVAGAELFTFGEMPETENHLLMIQTGTYLKNQEILAELAPSHPKYGAYQSDQAAVREWLLKRMQRIATQDFSEYNARAYQRYSISALRLLTDFADDPTLITASRNVLDLAAAKMAVGSSHSRRLPPFRRKVAAVAFIEPYSGQSNGFFDVLNLGEHQVASMLFYVGDLSQSPAAHVVSSAAARVDLTLTFASDYRPPRSVLELTADEVPSSYEQRLHHTTYEHYVRRPGFLITAGGITAPLANSIHVAGLTLTGTIVNALDLGKSDDRGTGLPTTLMLWSDRSRSSMGDLIRIEGRREPSGDGALYDHNLCVSGGFACGYNVVTPTDIDACFKPVPGESSKWAFLDSSDCPAAFGTSRRVLLARYIAPCGNDSTGDCAANYGNVGLIEAVDASAITPAQLSLQNFGKQVIDNNRAFEPNWLALIGGGPFGSNRTMLTGQYRRFDGTMLTFSTAGHQLDDDATGADDIPKLSQWGRAEGGPLTSNGAGRFTFRNPSNGAGFNIDMSNWNAPGRVDF